MENDKVTVISGDLILQAAVLLLSSGPPYLNGEVPTIVIFDSGTEEITVLNERTGELLIREPYK